MKESPFRGELANSESLNSVFCKSRYHDCFSNFQEFIENSVFRIFRLLTYERKKHTFKNPRSSQWRIQRGRRKFAFPKWKKMPFFIKFLGRMCKKKRRIKVATKKIFEFLISKWYSGSTPTTAQIEYMYL